MPPTGSAYQQATQAAQSLLGKAQGGISSAAGGLENSFGNIVNGFKNYIGQGINSINPNRPYTPQELHAANPYGIPAAQAQTLPSVQPTAQPISPVVGGITADQISRGFINFNSKAPVATQSGLFKQAADQISNYNTKNNAKVDPLLPALLTLRETRGGLDLTDSTRQLNADYEGVNNILNVKDTTRLGKFVNYPDYKTALLGGTNPYYQDINGKVVYMGQGGTPHVSEGVVNMILTSPAYAKYRQSGDLNDLNSVYTPASDDNPKAQKLSQDMENLRKYFK